MTDCGRAGSWSRVRFGAYGSWPPRGRSGELLIDCLLTLTRNALQLAARLRAMGLHLSRARQRSRLPAPTFQPQRHTWIAKVRMIAPDPTSTESPASPDQICTRLLPRSH